LGEIRSDTQKSVTEIGDLENWRDLARETAREYLQKQEESSKYRSCAA